MALCLNSTNGQCLKALFGRKVQEWVGHKVTFCAEQDRFGRDLVQAVRVFGSPELSSDKSIDIVLPRKKPKPRVLHAVQARGQTRQHPDNGEVAPEDEPQFDPENDGR